MFGQSYQIEVFKRFCQDCFVFDSNPSSTIHQERDHILLGELVITYTHYMLNSSEKDKLYKDLAFTSRDDLPNSLLTPSIHVPIPNGCYFDKKDVKTLKNAKFSPLILKLHELRLLEDKKKI